MPCKIGKTETMRKQACWPVAPSWLVQPLHLPAAFLEMPFLQLSLRKTGNLKPK